MTSLFTKILCHYKYSTKLTQRSTSKLYKVKKLYALLFKINYFKLDAVVLKFNYFSVPTGIADMYVVITFYSCSSSVLYFLLTMKSFLFIISQIRNKSTSFVTCTLQIHRSFLPENLQICHNPTINSIIKQLNVSNIR